MKKKGDTDMNTQVNDEIVYFNEFDKEWITERMLKHQLVADILMILAILGFGFALIVIGVIYG